MNTFIQAKPTWYKGIEFKSRLEARWAVFFDEMGAKWQYEPEKFPLDDGKGYIPDFYLPHLDVWVEIKPDVPDRLIDARQKCEQLMRRGNQVVLSVGEPRMTFIDARGNYYPFTSYYTLTVFGSPYNYNPHEPIEEGCLWGENFDSGDLSLGSQVETLAGGVGPCRIGEVFLFCDHMQEKLIRACERAMNYPFEKAHYNTSKLTQPTPLPIVPAVPARPVANKPGMIPILSPEEILTRPAPAKRGSKRKKAPSEKVPTVDTPPGNWDMPWLPPGEEPPIPRTVLITLQRTADTEKDRRRLRRLFGILKKYPGLDRFVVMFEDVHRTYRMDFPNHTTAYCDALVKDLTTVVGDKKNIQLEQQTL